MSFVFAVMLVVIVIANIQRNRNEAEEIQEGASFVIKKIESTIKGEITLFDKNGNEFGLVSYSFVRKGGVREEDSIYKAPCSKYLLIFRKNNYGDYKLFSKISQRNSSKYDDVCK